MKDRYAAAEYAYSHVPFYMDTKDKINLSEWDSIPKVSKKQFISEGRTLLSLEYIMAYQRGELLNYRTSGSTGLYMEIFWIKQDYIKSMLPFWMLRKKYYGILPGDSRFSFFTHSPDYNNDLYEEKENMLAVSKNVLYSDEFINAYEKIRNFKPRWAILQPSVAANIIYIKKKYGLPDITSLEYIECTGEMLSKQLKHQLGEEFHCKVANQYGSFEANSMAYECPYGHMHLMAENVYIETDEENRAYITTLQNKAMPFVRYGIGDRLEIDNITDCGCGNRNPVVKVIQGREHECVSTYDGEVHSGCIHKIMDIINGCLDNLISQYKVVQIDVNRFVLYIVSFGCVQDDGIVIKMKQLFCECYHEILGYRVSAEIIILDKLLPDENTGKLSSFERRFR